MVEVQTLYSINIKVSHVVSILMLEMSYFSVGQTVSSFVSNNCLGINHQSYGWIMLWAPEDHKWLQLDFHPTTCLYTWEAKMQDSV